MPYKSRTQNVRKVCGCEKWKECQHPWYLDYQRDTVRTRKNLDDLLGWHPRDFAEATDEARRAIVALLDGRDPKDILPGDDPTIRQLLDGYLAERPRKDRFQAGAIAKTVVGGRPFGDLRIGTVTTATIKDFQRVRPRVGGNRDLGLLRAAFNWAIAGGLVTASPFRVENVPVVRLQREQARTRRLQGDEESRLLAATGRLRDVIVAALETGMRRGEILSLQWWQVRFSPKAELFLPATKTKTKTDRRIPISSVLRPILERRRTDPAGTVIPPEGYVFGDEIGRFCGSIKTAWKGILKRAKIVDLHFHDLRRESGSRWMDAGIPLATIQRWLGHANIAQTSTYLGASLGADELDMLLYEQRIGRRTELTQIDAPSEPRGRKPTTSNQPLTEKTEQNSTIH